MLKEKLNEELNAALSVDGLEDESASRDADAACEAVDTLQKLQDELAGAKDQLLRKQADFENYKKRMIKLQEDNRKIALRDMAIDVVQINDDLLRALDASNAISAGESEAGAARDSFVQGVSMISKRIESILEKYGVVEIDALNQEFDPNLHEAIEINAGDVEHDTVTLVHQKGYKINDLLLRSAKVRVTKPEKKDEKKSTEAVEPSEIL